jgi:N,N-dimethylformamidase
MMLPDVALYGYASSFSVGVGEPISFHVSAQGTTEYDAQLVRLRHGIDLAGSPGFVEEQVDAEVNGRCSGTSHPTWIGSYLEVADRFGMLQRSETISVAMSMYPTLLDRALQGVIGSWDADTGSGFVVSLQHGRLALNLGDGTRSVSVVLRDPMQVNRWYHVSAGFDLGSGLVWLEQVPARVLGDRSNALAADVTGERVTKKVDLQQVVYAAPFRIGAVSRRHGQDWLPAGLFNGKIGNPAVTSSQSDEEPIAAWDFAVSNRPDGALLRHVEDVSGHNLHAVAVNAPTRGVTGADWNGTTDDYRTAPGDYGAIHFHEDDIEDARWPVAVEWTPPASTPSGIYALRLRSEGYVEHVPFVVRPDADKRAKVALLLPTGSYLAYANDRLPFDSSGAELLIGHVPVLQRDDLELQAHYDFGRSCYELHPDGSGVVFSSRRRPIVNMRPRYLGWFMAAGPWQFPADLCIAHWLDQTGIDYDVITDEDLHRAGVSILDGYRVVLTGSHPEYVSLREMEAIEQYLAAGGRLMYLGGNGFYWRVSYDPERPYLMEVRRSENGSRPHTAAPGEHRHSTTGEHCGLWRNLGRPPQRLLGVGMGSEGFDYSVGYARLPDSYAPAAAFAFEGVTNEVFGAFGLMGGGAAGAELDRFDPELGSPLQAFLLASSVARHSDNYQEASEDLFETPPTTGGSQSAAVRSDVVYFPLEGGGAVFSVGSIAWTGALSHNHYDNDVARITHNVLRHFLTAEEPGDRRG